MHSVFPAFFDELEKIAAPYKPLGELKKSFPEPLTKVLTLAKDSWRTIPKAGPAADTLSEGAVQKALQVISSPKSKNAPMPPGMSKLVPGLLLAGALAGGALYASMARESKEDEKKKELA